MKIAKVSPIFKGGNNLHAENYRPISVLPVFSKILEKNVYNLKRVRDNQPDETSTWQRVHDNFNHIRSLNPLMPGGNRKVTHT